MISVNRVSGLVVVSAEEDPVFFKRFNTWLKEKDFIQFNEWATKHGRNDEAALFHDEVAASKHILGDNSAFREWIGGGCRYSPALLPRPTSPE
ncbi:MAG: hypothetical protein IH984_15030 [Planctomycetes bacterium]|nr:hypothetical protein [Planctomycetota bacterium]